MRLLLFLCLSLLSFQISDSIDFKEIPSGVDLDVIELAIRMLNHDFDHETCRDGRMTHPVLFEYRQCTGSSADVNFDLVFVKRELALERISIESTNLKGIWYNSEGTFYFKGHISMK